MVAKKTSKNIRKGFRLGKAIDEAIEEAARVAVRNHQISGVPLAEWRDGKVVHIDPFTGEIVPPPDPRKKYTSLYNF